MINDFYTRAIISIASTSLLHASIFYTLADTRESQIITPRTIEIALLDMPKAEKKEEIKAKEELKEEVKPKEEPKQAVWSKPKPMEKQKPLTETKPEAQPSKEIAEEAATEYLKVTQNESAMQQNENKISQKRVEAQKAVSKTDPTLLELYLFKVREKIQENLRYPPLAKRLRLDGESIVEFKILDDGGVDESSCEIKKSSGHKTLDRQAIETILSVLPFEAPPDGSISIVVPVAFNLR